MQDVPLLRHARHFSHRCSQWNDSFTPVEWCEENQSFGCTQSDCPQTCIDWCDAYAFCHAAGKHLCGKRGGGALADWSLNGTPSDATNPSRSQWYHACSANGQNTYPYGDTYGKKTCNGGSTTVTYLPVGSKPDCESSTPGYEGVFDLSGNAGEWDDNCLEVSNVAAGKKNDGSDDECTVRGGYAAVALVAEDYACAALASGSRATPFPSAFAAVIPDSPRPGHAPHITLLPNHPDRAPGHKRAQRPTRGGRRACGTPSSRKPMYLTRSCTACSA